MRRRSFLVALLVLGALIAGPLLSAGCDTTDEYEGTVQGVEGDQMTIVLDDGSTVEITVSTAQNAAARLLVGQQVAVTVTDGELEEMRPVGIGEDDGGDDGNAT